MNKINIVLMRAFSVPVSRQRRSRNGDDRLFTPLCLMRGLKQAGFTLLEIMIALAIFAVVSSALIRNAAQAVRQTTIIQDRTLAFWIAENHLNQMRAVPRGEADFPGIGSDRFSITMAERDWEVVMDVEATKNLNVRRLIISVFNPEDLDNSVVELTGFIGKY